MRLTVGGVQPTLEVGFNLPSAARDVAGAQILLEAQVEEGVFARTALDEEAGDVADEVEEPAGLGLRLRLRYPMLTHQEARGPGRILSLGERLSTVSSWRWKAMGSRTS